MARPDEGMVGGVLVGRYQLTAHLRPGHVADFWEGRCLADNQRIAIKLLKPSLVEDATSLARFERETQVLATLNHPNLLRVIERGRTHLGVPWVVTELRSGEPLSDVITELVLTVPQVRHIGAQIADVLDAAHSHGIVHRGLEPECVLLVREGNDPHVVKIQDFGLAHLARSSSVDAPELTQAGERLGRFEYMAPEYIEELVLDPKTDLYGLGIILFEMLTGQPPFVGRPGEILRKHVYEPPMRPSELTEAALPTWLDQLIVTLLAKDPAARPPSAAVVAGALRGRPWLPAR